jgi:hypothetical protein
MGIKFRCPNGHKLNVKSFLAGKRGVCPDCGQTFRIPPEDTHDSGVVATALPSRRGASSAGEEGPLEERTFNVGENLEESDFEAAVAVAAAAVQPERAFPITGSAPVAAAASFPAVHDVTFLPPKPSSQPSPAAQPAADSEAAPEIFFPAVKTEAKTQPSAVPHVKPLPVPAPQAPPAPADPISEAPDAVWYVRPPSGGQYGPARGEIMRKWLAEGRVSSDSLVWRDGWAEWRDAGPLFPALAAGGVTVAAISPLHSAPVAAARPTDRRAASKTPAGKKANSDLAVAALVCLVLVCLILVTVLAIVLSQGGA